MQVYDDIFVAGLFIPWADVLLDEVASHPARSVLDVACGPGTVTRTSRPNEPARTGRVVGADISTAMLAIARASPPRTGRSSSTSRARGPLAVDSASSTSSCASRASSSSPTGPPALLEMRRALRPGGRIGLSVWRPDRGPAALRRPCAGGARCHRRRGGRPVRARPVGVLVARRPAGGRRGGRVLDVRAQRRGRSTRSSPGALRLRWQPGCLAGRADAGGPAPSGPGTTSPRQPSGISAPHLSTGCSQASTALEHRGRSPLAHVRARQWRHDAAKPRRIDRSVLAIRSGRVVAAGMVHATAAGNHAGETTLVRLFALTAAAQAAWGCHRARCGRCGPSRGRAWSSTRCSSAPGCCPALSGLPLIDSLRESSQPARKTSSPRRSEPLRSRRSAEHVPAGRRRDARDRLGDRERDRDHLRRRAGDGRRAHAWRRPRARRRHGRRATIMQRTSTLTPPRPAQTDIIMRSPLGSITTRPTTRCRRLPT